MYDIEPDKLARDIWSWLNFNLTGTYKVTFDNVPDLQGFEAWRRVVVPLGAKTLARRHELYSKIHTPARA